MCFIVTIQFIDFKLEIKLIKNTLSQTKTPRTRTGTSSQRQLSELCNVKTTAVLPTLKT